MLMVQRLLRQMASVSFPQQSRLRIASNKYISWQVSFEILLCYRSLCSDGLYCQIYIMCNMAYHVTNISLHINIQMLLKSFSLSTNARIVQLSTAIMTAVYLQQ